MIQDKEIRKIMFALTLKDRAYIRNLWITKGFKKINSENLFAYWKKRIETNQEDYLFAITVLNEFYDITSGKRIITNNNIGNQLSPILNKKEFLETGEENNICYIVTCYNEKNLVRNCIQSIRKNSNAKIILINDGGDTDELLDIATHFDAKLVLSKNFKNQELGHKWWERFFEEGINSGCDYIVKMDTDSEFIRPLRYKIGNLDYFGTINGYYYVQGGVQGFSRRFALKILHSEVLYEINEHGDIEDGGFSEDRSIAWVAGRLDQEAQRWDEIKSIWPLTQKLKLKHSNQFAIIHPFNVCDDYIKRLQICNMCEFYTKKTRSCQKLVDNQYIYSQLKNENANCPIQKW